MMGKVEEQTPYVIVSFQECERMNTLMNEIRRSLKELHLGLKVRHYNLFNDLVTWMIIKQLTEDNNHNIKVISLISIKYNKLIIN